ncbi:MAG: DUF1559 domain-containing protein [Planctomycetota bacterium]
MRKAQPAFTLVELLVVIAIIGILVALLLPAVQAARESARRALCSNNIRQIGLALLSAHDVEKAFPRGLYSASEAEMDEAGNPGLFTPEDGLGWATKALPFLEEQAVYDSLSQTGVPEVDADPWKPFFFVKLAIAAVTPPIDGPDSVISTFLCPSVDFPEQKPEAEYFGLNGITLNTSGYSAAHYKGSRGYQDRGMYVRTEEAERAQIYFADYNGDGIDEQVEKRPFNRVRIKDVVDGTSKTIAIGESAFYVEAQEFPVWLGTDFQDASLLFKTDNVTPLNCLVGGPWSYPSSDEFLLRFPDDDQREDCSYGWHVGGVYFGFVDGSVRFLTDDLDQRVYWLLGDRMDGEIIGEL